MTASEGSNPGSAASAETSSLFVSAADLLRIMPTARRADIDLFVDPLNSAMAEYEINRPARAACFLAQIAHESMALHCTCELWGPTPAQRSYEFRKALGNCQPGDGARFKGRGLLQITGRENMRRCSLALFGDERLLERPELLEEPMPAARSAGWFWRDVKKLNAPADNLDMTAITRRINGGLTGFTDRMVYFARAKLVLGVGI